MLRFGHVALDHKLAAFGACERRAAGINARAGKKHAFVFRADLSAQKRLLIHRPHSGFAHLYVVERRHQMVEAHHVLKVHRAGVDNAHPRVFAQLRILFKRGLFDHVDLACEQRVQLRLRVFQRQPFDAINEHFFATREPGRRFSARHVLGVFQVDRLHARLVFILLEDVRAGACVVVNHLERIGRRDAGRHDERGVG